MYIQELPIIINLWNIPLIFTQVSQNKDLYTRTFQHSHPSVTATSLWGFPEGGQISPWAPPGVQGYTVINRCSVPSSRQGTLQINRTAAPALQNKNAISTYFASEQILPFGFAEQVQLHRIPRNTRRNMQRHFCFGRSIRSSWCSKKCITIDISNCNCLLDR